MFCTDVITMHNGREQRNIRWFSPRARYNVAHGVKTRAQLDELISFFRLHKGRAIAFRFQDMLDSAFTDELLGLGDGARQDFALLKTYRYGARFEQRRITKPVENSIKLHIDGVDSLDYTLDKNNGILSLKHPAKIGSLVKASGEFEVVVRFDTDQLHATLDDYGVYSWGEIPLVQVEL